MKAAFCWLICGIFLLTPPVFSFAGTYKYRDSDGRLSFVDDLSKVPSQYRSRAKSISETEDSIIIYDTPAAKEESPKKALQEESKAAVKSTLRQKQTAVVIRGNRVLVPVQVAIGSGVENLSLLLDTGATSTVFHRKSLSKLSLPSGKVYNARVAGGGIVKSEKIDFKYVKVGPFKINRTKAMVIDLQGKELSFDGMLGMDFLKTHPYQIDFENSLITWQVTD